MSGINPCPYVSVPFDLVEQNLWYELNLHVSVGGDSGEKFAERWNKIHSLTKSDRNTGLSEAQV